MSIHGPPDNKPIGLSALDFLIINRMVLFHVNTVALNPFVGKTMRKRLQGFYRRHCSFDGNMGRSDKVKNPSRSSNPTNLVGERFVRFVRFIGIVGLSDRSLQAEGLS